MAAKTKAKAAKAAKPKATTPGKRQVALEKLEHVEGALLTVQATIASYVRDVQDVRAMLDPPPTKENA